MATAFKNVADNATSTTTTTLTSTGVTSIVVASGTGAKFPAVPFFLTIWTGNDPGADAQMEKVTCTAISTDTLTITATTKTHTGTQNVANLWTAQNVTDAQTAINTLENGNSLGYTPITTSFTTTSTTAVQVTGLSATVTIPSGGRKVKITAWTGQAILSAGTTSTNVTMTIWDGTVGTGTQLALSQAAGVTNIIGGPLTTIAIVTPSAGSKTYNVGLNVNANTGQLFASATSPAFIMVELI